MNASSAVDTCSYPNCDYKKIMELLPDAIISIDKNNKINYVNKPALELLNAKNPAELLCSAASDVIIKCYDEESDNEHPIRYICLRCMDNQLLIVESEYINHDNETIVIIRTSSLSKRNERILRLYNREKEKMSQFENDNIKRSNFQSTLSHELKTPINIIFGSLQILEIYKNEISGSKDNTCNNKVGKNIDLIKQNCYRLIRLINNIIDMDKLESGFMKVHYKRIDIVDLVRNISESAYNYAILKEIDLAFKTKVESLNFLCDPEKIERILLNLISNAIKFTNPKGKIIIKLSRDDKNVYISVKDTGVGIPTEKINLIFNRYEQADDSLIRNRGGSGIGLNLVKEMVSLVNGSISVSSILGKETEFIISLPIIKEDFIEVCEEKTSYDSKIEEICIELSDIYKNMN